MKGDATQDTLIRSYDNAIENPRGKIKKLFYSVIPRHILRNVPFELRLTWLKISKKNVRKRFANSKDLLVNLGCGPQGRPGWINVDAVPGANVNCVYDCRKSLPFQDGSARGIFAEHFFEHLDYQDEVPHFLAECRRVLQPGGVIRIIVPDAGAYLRAYCRGDWDELQKMRVLGENHSEAGMGFAYNTRMELINFVFRQWGQHKFAYDFETLSFILKKHGFSSVQEQKFGGSILPDICIDSPERKHESLYVDAVK
ncbi:MAG TPA: methyltransferase domain-containing protein [Candidatus Acidoferrales bacterium]|nr:methyltransferase domain-containing protein [Candidatus Acidoferrales bacterium]